MLIVVTGTCSSGKSTFENYLVERKGFTRLRLVTDPSKLSIESLKESMDHVDSQSSLTDALQTLSVQSSRIIDSDVANDGRISNLLGEQSADEFHICHNTVDMMHYITRNWRANLITSDIVDKDILQIVSKRPYVLLIFIDAPVLLRYERHLSYKPAIDLQDFIKDHDAQMYGNMGIASNFIQNRNAYPTIYIVNNFDSIATFHSHIDFLDLLNQDRIRPRWDSYFMTLASLASMRSNCMKRRVGAILVRDNRIVATGYNGTPRGVQNCNEGGCPRCNESVSPLSNEECLCLHAEENALLEAGRERVGNNAVLYCNTCPCLKCTIKIVQTGVKEVVYNLSYKMDSASARVFLEAGINLRQYSPP